MNYATPHIASMWRNSASHSDARASAALRIGLSARAVGVDVRRPMPQALDVYSHEEGGIASTDRSG